MEDNTTSEMQTLVGRNKDISVPSIMNDDARNRKRSETGRDDKMNKEDEVLLPPPPLLKHRLGANEEPAIRGRCFTVGLGHPRSYALSAFKFFSFTILYFFVNY
ncbi:unnamed protein product [Cuscuta epithymum]|uniref:Uncharacterized protein n=1 Tax=Cuscuta epithymum TaxID=186058 RepID=A0AAV0G4L6_9ASTE|nr:unnamed protein product [Cuscuta epithymum]